MVTNGKKVNEKTLEVLEGEIKLLKGEIKKNLGDVRDFLLGVKMPLLDEGAPANIVASRAGTEEDRINESNDSTASSPDEQAEPPQETDEPREAVKPRRVSEKPVRPVMQPVFEDENDVSPPDTEESVQGENHMESEVKADTLAQKIDAESQPAAQVNMLANLVRWVQQAKRDIGISQLPTFLDVYSAAGSISPEIREAILQLAQVIAPAVESGDGSNGHHRALSEQLGAFLELYTSGAQLSPELQQSIVRFVKMIEHQSNESNLAEVWSRLMLELNGILGGGTSLRSLNTASGEQKAQSQPEKKPNTKKSANRQSSQPDRSYKLKLVLPLADGLEREFEVVP